MRIKVVLKENKGEKELGFLTDQYVMIPTDVDVELVEQRFGLSGLYRIADERWQFLVEKANMDVIRILILEKKEHI